jgi:hypothetical protein
VAFAFVIPCIDFQIETISYFCFMSRSKKIFLAVCISFFLGLVYLSYDISSKTTFPGSKSQLKERLKKQYLKADSAANDSLKAVHRQ